jgi:hypothetical protein
MGSDAGRVVGLPSITGKRGESRVTEQSATEVGRGRRQAKAEGKIKEGSE